MEMIYKFRDGARFSGDAQAVGRELNGIRSSHGSLTPEAIVKTARPKASVLHDYFEWNNRKAAIEYRLWQARVLVCSIVSVRGDTEKGRPVRSFVSVNHAYEPIEVVLGDAIMRERVLTEIMNGIEAMKEKARAYEELSDVIFSLDKAHRVASRHFVRRARRAGKRSFRRGAGHGYARPGSARQAARV